MRRPISLVTGIAGFMGSHLAQELINRNHIVMGIDDLSGGFMENVPPHATFVQGSILDVELIDKLFKAYHFDYVWHLAAYAAEGLSHFIKRFNYMNNVVGSMNLINASVNNNVKCFVFTSSIAVYGSGQVPFSEEMKPEPEDSYGVAKLVVEQELELTRKMFGLPYVIFRPHNVFGENQNISDKYRNVVGIWMNQLMSGNPMTIFGDGEQSRKFTYVGNIIERMARSVEVEAAHNTIFNIGGDEVYTVNELSKMVAESMGIYPRIERLDARREVYHALSSHTRVNAILPREYDHISVPEGLARMAMWARGVGVRRPIEFSNIEISKNLPPSWMKKEESLAAHR